jgi:hypothetical protein
MSAIQHLGTTRRLDDLLMSNVKAILNCADELANFYPNSTMNYKKNEMERLARF